MHFDSEFAMRGLRQLNLPQRGWSRVLAAQRLRWSGGDLSFIERVLDQRALQFAELHHRLALAKFYGNAQVLHRRRNLIGDPAQSS